MARVFKLQATPTDVILRALAIAMVVYNHSHMSPNMTVGLAGGMTFLLMLSGVNFARFAMKDATADSIRRSIVAIAWRVFLPAMALVLASFAYYRRFDLFELLFVRNWRDMQWISVFHPWFPQLLLQLLFGLYLSLCIPSVARLAVRKPLRFMLVLFGAGVLIRAAGPLLWDTSYLGHRLPHTMLWNFALGGAIYFLVLDRRDSPASGKWLAVACVLTGAVVGYYGKPTPFLWLTASGILLITVDRVPLPGVVARTTALVSAATYTIFLTHGLWFKVPRTLYAVFVGPNAMPSATMLFVAGLLLGTLTWVVSHAFVRAVRTVRLENRSVAAGNGRLSPVIQP